MTSKIRDVTKAGVQAETTLVDLIGNAINENSQTAALTLEKIFDRLSKITDHNNDVGNSFADRLSTALDKLRSAHDGDKGGDKGWNDTTSSDKTDTTSTTGDLDSTTELAATKPGSVTDTVSTPTVSDTQDETAAITPVSTAGAPKAAPAAAAASTVTGFPDASTTGIPAGTNLTKFTGTYRVTQDNAVI
ncbi:hypothetical protein ACFQ33_20940, partial [Mycoplana ramosa]